MLGKIHGQFKDLKHIFTKFGVPPKKKYLFLGDVIGKSENSLECLTLILCLMLRYPKHIYILRGFQEDPSIARVFGFYDEGSLRNRVT